MAALTVQTSTFAGVNNSSAAADVAGDTFANDGRTLVHFTNANASSRTVTIPANDTSRPGFGTIATPDTVITVPGSGTNGGICTVGPFPTERFNDPTTGLVSMAYSAVTGLSVSVVKSTQYQ
jgi:hypothetical protein